MNLPTKLSDVIMQNKSEILALLNTYMETNMNLLFIGSNNTFKSRIITLLVEEYYNKKNINNYKHLVMNIDCFMDITFSNSINEIKTFCKTNTIHPKIVVIDNFDIINESNQQYLKKWMDNCKNTFFIFGCENTNKINEIIQTRITPIYIEDLNMDNYRELIETISKKENIIIDNVDELLKYKNMTIYFIYNLFYKLKLLKQNHIKDIIPYITLIDYTLFDNYFELLKNKQLKNGIDILFGLYDKGYSLIDIYHFMYEYIKVSNHPNKYIIIEKLCLYIQYIYDGFDNKIMLMFFTNEIVNQ
jgi:DNA polymerase III delta prime subunit